MSRLEALEEQNKEQAKQTGDLKALIAGQAEQISTHNKILFYPLCLRQLCVLAQEAINVKDGNKHGAGVIPLKPGAPNWAKSWLIGSGNGCLNEDDLDIIFTSTPGSTRGDANKAAHDISEKDQAAAVCSVADAKEQASLARIFAFVHGHPVTDK